MSELLLPFVAGLGVCCIVITVGFLGAFMLQSIGLFIERLLSKNFVSHEFSYYMQSRADACIRIMAVVAVIVTLWLIGHGFCESMGLL